MRARLLLLPILAICLGAGLYALRGRRAPGIPLAGASLPPPAIPAARPAAPSVAQTGPFEDAAGHWGFRDAMGREVIAPRFAWLAPFREGWARAAEEVPEEAGVALRWGLVDSLGAWVLRPSFDGLSEFRSGRALVRAGEELRWIDAQGRPLGSLSLTGPRSAFWWPASLDGDDAMGLLERLAQEGLGREGDPWEVDVDPRPRESHLRLAIQPLHGGGLLIRERGWEGGRVALRLPGWKPEELLVLARALASRSGREVHAMEGNLGWENGEERVQVRALLGGAEISAQGGI